MRRAALESLKALGLDGQPRLLHVIVNRVDRVDPESGKAGG